jgi:hypothetical protein
MGIGNSDEQGSWLGAEWTSADMLWPAEQGQNLEQTNGTGTEEIGKLSKKDHLLDTGVDKNSIFFLNNHIVAYDNEGKFHTVDTLPKSCLNKGYKSCHMIPNLWFHKDLS